PHAGDGSQRFLGRLGHRDAELGRRDTGHPHPGGRLDVRRGQRELAFPFGQMRDVHADAQRLTRQTTDRPAPRLDLELHAIARVGQEDGVVGEADVPHGGGEGELAPLADGDEEPEASGDGERQELEVPVPYEERRHQAPSLSRVATAGAGIGAAGTPSISSCSRWRSVAGSGIGSMWPSTAIATRPVSSGTTSAIPPLSPPLPPPPPRPPPP